MRQVAQLPLADDVDGFEEDVLDIIPTRDVLISQLPARFAGDDCRRGHASEDRVVIAADSREIGIPFVSRSGPAKWVAVPDLSRCHCRRRDGVPHALHVDLGGPKVSVVDIRLDK